jgi:hypothetical protein
VHSGASKLQNAITLFFILRLDGYIYDKKHARTSYV